MTTSSFGELPGEVLLVVNDLCNRYEAAWQAGESPAIESYLDEIPAEYRDAGLDELLPIEIAYRRTAGQVFNLQEYRTRFPELSAERLLELVAAEVTVAAPNRVSGGAELYGNSNVNSMPSYVGDYEILELIGSGGMGAVYRAIHRRMDRTVAVKILRPEIAQDPRLIQRFSREVRAAARLTHPNIITALDCREESGVSCLVTEFVDGEDLSALVRRDGPLPIELAVEIVLQVAEGLHYAHQRGVIHRDIKPANVLLDRSGTAKILDMGLARLETDELLGTPNDLTTTGMVMGTAAYMAPEQARSSKNADARSDIYSLGCTLYYLLTGRSAYACETVIETILAHVNQPIPPLREAMQNAPPNELDSVYQRMIAKDPADRFPTMAEVITALRQVRDSLAASSHGVPSGDDPSVVQPSEASDDAVEAAASLKRRPATSRNLAWGAGILAAAAIGVLALLLGKLPNDADEPRGSAAGLTFDGRSSYVSAPSLLLDPQQQVTLEAVLETRTPRTSNVVSWLGSEWMALFQDSEGHWGVSRRVGDESRLIATTEPVPPDEIFHLAGTWDGQDLQLFLNGEPVEVRRVHFPLAETAGGFFIGGVPRDLLPEGQNDRFFAGRVYTVRVSEGVRYTSPFRWSAHFESDSATLALFRLDERQGDVARDSSGHGHHATIHEASWSDN